MERVEKNKKQAIKPCFDLWQVKKCVFDLANFNLLCQSLRGEKKSLHYLYFSKSAWLLSS